MNPTIIKSLFLPVKSRIKIMSDSIVIIPTYNEIENIESIVRAVFSLEQIFSYSHCR